ncbi:MAG TPA: sigma-54 dependent transcriptional regulator [Burkholderiales bacterium]|jgi:DNA-binding NtrC family response regulator
MSTLPQPRQIGAQEAREGKPALLIVDDDPLITDTLAFALGTEYTVYACDSRPHAIELLRQLDAPPPLALVDLGLPPAPHAPDEGFRLIGDLLAHSPKMKIFVLSGQNDAANARHARALGAWEFVAKPADPASLARVLARGLELPAAEDDDLVGASPALAKLKNQVAQFAAAPYPVLIEGESGSGKELVAKRLHRLSPRAGRAYFSLNCAAISPQLVEPTLFGYVKGAFTGAQGNKPGFFEDAADGTLFLDEIGELPLDMQAKLLRVLENGEYQRVGETQRRTARCRVIAATNRDLRRAVREGAFRADLYHRLSVFTLSVPPLRELDQDKLALLEHFRHNAFELDEAATARWMRYDFPGNVRELRNIVIRLAAKYPGQRLSVAELEPELDLQSVVQEKTSLVDEAVRQLERGGQFDLDQTLKAWERSYIEAALRLTRGNVSQAAKLLGINRTTLYSRLEK